MDQETRLIERILASLGDDLALVTDQDIAFEVVEIERMDKRPAGEGSIHVSFRLDFWREGSAQQGCLLLPLPEAISIAGLLLEIPVAGIESRREDDTLDPNLKDAMVEVGNMVGGSVGSAIRSLSIEDTEARFAGCQGVRAGVRPVLAYEENTPLTVCRASVRVAGFPESIALLMLPILASSESA